jgi:hypothetical protein
MNRFSILLLSVLAAACARTEPADPTPGEDLEEAQAPLDDLGAADPTTPGRWEAGAQGESQAVIFRNQQGEALFTMRCDLRGGLIVQRPGLVARGNLALMQLRTADVVRRLAVNAGAGPQPQVEARVPYNDQLIAALLSFDEPLEVRYEGLDTLNLPPSPIVGDLVRTCQQTGGTPAEAEAQTNAAQPQPGAEPQAQQPAPEQNQL